MRTHPDYLQRTLEYITMRETVDERTKPNNVAGNDSIKFILTSNNQWLQIKIFKILDRVFG